MCLKASETVSWMLDAAVGARSSPRRKDLLHRPTAKKKKKIIKIEKQNLSWEWKSLSSQALLSPKSFSRMLSSGATLWGWRKHLRRGGRELASPSAGGSGGSAPRTPRRYLVRGLGRGFRRACGRRRAPGRRRCRRPWGSLRPCPCACRWGPGGYHPSTWGGSRGPARLSRAR